MTLRRRVNQLEAERPVPAERSGARQKLAELLDAIASRTQPSDEERERARRWLAMEWPAHLERIKGAEQTSPCHGGVEGSASCQR